MFFFCAVCAWWPVWPCSALCVLGGLCGLFCTVCAGGLCGLFSLCVLGGLCGLCCTVCAWWPARPVYRSIFVASVLFFFILRVFFLVV